MKVERENKDVNVEGEEGREREPGGVNGWSEVKKESEMAWTPTKQNDTTNVTRRVGEWDPSWGVSVVDDVV